jgi:hypothetical protein
VKIAAGSPLTATPDRRGCSRWARWRARLNSAATPPEPSRSTRWTFNLRQAVSSAAAEPAGSDEPPASCSTIRRASSDRLGEGSVMLLDRGGCRAIVSYPLAGIVAPVAPDRSGQVHGPFPSVIRESGALQRGAGAAFPRAGATDFIRGRQPDKGRRPHPACLPGGGRKPVSA